MSEPLPQGQEGIPLRDEMESRLNAKIVSVKSDFVVPAKEDKPRPTSDEIEANKKKWGYSG